MMLLTLLGFFLALLVLVGFLIWRDPACLEKWYGMIVRRPMLVVVHRSGRRILLSALPWWLNSLVAPPGLADPSSCPRSYPFRRDV